MSFNELLTTAQVADLLGVKPDTVKRYIHRGLIKASKFGRDWLIAPEAVEQYAKTRRKPGRPRSPKKGD